MQKRAMFVILAITTSVALGVDAACVDITIPPTVIDSNTTFTPQIAVKNNGSEVLRDVPVSFNVVRASDPADTIYHDTASSGQIGVGETGLVDFGSECSPDLDAFIMTGITKLPGDANPHNDTCSLPLFVRYVDVRTEIVSPRDTESPGLIPVQVRLTNNGNMATLVPRVDVTIRPSGYAGWRENIAIGLGGEQVVTLNPWVCSAGENETCTAWITDPADMNHSNDTDVVIINAAGIEDWTEMGLDAGMSFGLSPSPLAGNVLHVEYSLNQVGPAEVSLFDIRGRLVLTRDFTGSLRGRLPLDLRHVSGGVYLVRLDDGQRSLVQKLIVQR